MASVYRISLSTAHGFKILSGAKSGQKFNFGRKNRANRLSSGQGDAPAWAKFCCRSFRSVRILLPKMSLKNFLLPEFSVLTALCLWQKIVKKRPRFHFAPGKNWIFPYSSMVNPVYDFGWKFTIKSTGARAWKIPKIALIPHSKVGNTIEKLLKSSHLPAIFAVCLVPSTSWKSGDFERKYPKNALKTP